ncbi:hypothetical protein [Salinimicrobium sp. GXAS 041]|uniref:hypothetical protein n=1 Tax=Salinimicrobium sp. GXAS 041 TaxID=3400806 RepID=UPI003C747411
MKKHLFSSPLIFLLLSIFTISCGKEEPLDLPAPEFTKARALDMPAYFEFNHNYTIEVVYMLPSSCYRPIGLGIERKGNTAEGLRNVFVTGIARKNSEATCSENGKVASEITESFYMRIDQAQPYMFYFYNGLNAEGKYHFTEVEIPVKILEEK